MPQYKYRGRDKEGRLRTGERFANTVDNLNAELIKEGIFPTQIDESHATIPIWNRAIHLFRKAPIPFADLAIFSRQMQLLHKAGVPMITALRQLASYTRNRSFSNAILGLIDHIENGQSLSTAMRSYPDIFPPLIVSIVHIGETTGRLSEAFGHLHTYLEFESRHTQQLKGAFRYPLFVLISIIVAIVVLNIFVIPTFGQFFSSMENSLPWQTQLLIASSNFFLYVGPYVLVLLVIATIFFLHYINTTEGRYNWDKFKLKIPVLGKLLKRIILIRFAQSFSIVIDSGIGITQGLTLVRNLLQNSFINRQISDAQELIERGNTFTQAITHIDLFSPMELQIISVGEKNGELGSAMSYIGNFHTHEIEFDLKRMNDLIGPILIAVASVLILIVALGIYLPIWNMINLVHN